MTASTIYSTSKSRPAPFFVPSAQQPSVAVLIFSVVSWMYYRRSLVNKTPPIVVQQGSPIHHIYSTPVSSLMANSTCSTRSALVVCLRDRSVTVQTVTVFSQPSSLSRLRISSSTSLSLSRPMKLYRTPEALVSTEEVTHRGPYIDGFVKAMSARTTTVG